MPKFIIDNIIIEKSEKDISTGVKYSLSKGINLICGNNEAGKSSLMNFIREGFFRPVKTDTGKIFFSVCDGADEKHYRADIKNSQKKSDRLKLYDSDNELCDYALMDKLINRKYFEQGFTINLDDLMNIQYDNNVSLVNVIKDPSGDKLNSNLQRINSKIEEYIGANNRPRKSVTNILNKISEVNSGIYELSRKESQYNDAIASIQELEEELRHLSGEEEYVKILINLKESNLELNRLIDLQKHAALDFNNKLYLNREGYISLLQNTGKYDSNEAVIQRDKNKLETLTLEISTGMNRLREEYGITPSEEDITGFVIDYEKINTIRELLVKVDNNKTESKAYEKTIEDIEQTIIKLKNDLEYVKNSKKDKFEKDKLEELYSVLDDGMKQYKYLASEINNIEKNVKINSGGIHSNKNSLIMFGALFLLMVSCAGISFYQKVTTAGIFSVLMAVLIAIGFAIQKLSSYNDGQNNDKIRKQTQQEAILSNLTEKLKDYYQDIENVESSYLPSKIEDLKHEINAKIINCNSYNENIIKYESDIKFNELKLSNISEKIQNLNNETDSVYKNINELIKSDNAVFNLNENKYIDAVNKIKNLQNIINEKNNVSNEIKQIEDINKEILDLFNKFIIENEVDITLTSDLKSNAEKLRIYCDKNNEQKKQIDILNVTIENLNNGILKLKEAEKPYIQIFQSFDYSSDFHKKLEEIEVLKEEKQALKKEAEFKKRELEDFEGIVNLKNEKNVLISEYRSIIKDLFLNKTIAAITSIAKSNFDKTQPDLINAQRYLSLLTDGKYTGINLDTEEIINNDGSIIKKWTDLSRGTKEQLYLALRFGYASNYSKDKSTLKNNGRADLPVIIDDAFVNFDYERTHNALKCLIDFSKTNQILFFTCHTNMIKQHFEELGLKEKDNLNIIYIN